MSYSVILGNLGNTCDRFLPTGYKDQPSKPEAVRQAASIAGVAGIELVGSWDVTKETVGDMKKLLIENKLKLASIIPDHFSHKRWGKGSFTSRDPEIRKLAVQVTKEMMDAAVEMGGDLLNLWPGQDGFDYPFQADFVRQREWFVEGIREAAAHRRDVRLALEYKPKEPRTHCFLARAADTLLTALDTGASNVGVCIDTGHAFAAGENLAEAAALLLKHNKLFHLHCNDNYRSWDDDMIVGTLHHTEYIELFFWLDRLGYKGWYSMDQYPYREDGRDSINESIRWIDGMRQRMRSFGHERFAALLAQGDAVAMARTMRDFLGIGDAQVASAKK